LFLTVATNLAVVFAPLLAGVRLGGFMSRFTKVITNKYFIVTVCFAAWIMYFDQNDFLTQRERQQELNTLKDNIAYLKKEIADMQVETKSLTTNMQGMPNDPKQLEHYARETYRMKHDGEDVYVIEE
jgi:cell division protein FtsB